MLYQFSSNCSRKTHSRVSFFCEGEKIKQSPLYDYFSHPSLLVENPEIAIAHWYWKISALSSSITEISSFKVAHILYNLHPLSWATQKYFRWDLSWRQETGGDGLTWLFESEIFLSLTISAMASQCPIGTPEFPSYLGLMMFTSTEIIVNHINF